MYLPRSNALRVSHRTWTGPRTRRVCWGRSRRHGRAVSEAAVPGTRAWTAVGHREVPQKVPVGPALHVPGARKVTTSDARICPMNVSHTSEGLSHNAHVRSEDERREERRQTQDSGTFQSGTPIRTANRKG